MLVLLLEGRDVQCGQTEGRRVRHGTRWCYTNGCRRPECRAANAAAQRTYQQNRRRADPDYRRPRRPRTLPLLGDYTFALFAAVGVQPHMVEWYDPTADEALERLAA